MIFHGTLTPLVLKVWETTFYNIQAKDDKWMNLFYSLGKES
jgi:hypothetical protein